MDAKKSESSGARVLMCASSIMRTKMTRPSSAKADLVRKATARGMVTGSMVMMLTRMRRFCRRIMMSIWPKDALR
jgi:hypothetical protein